MGGVRLRPRRVYHSRWAGATSSLGPSSCPYAPKCLVADGHPRTHGASSIPPALRGSLVRSWSSPFLHRSIIPSGCALPYGSSWADRTGTMGLLRELPLYGGMRSSLLFYYFPY